MYQPEILVTPKNVEAVRRLIDAGADAVLIGEQHFGLRLAGEFTRKDVEEAVRIAHEKGAKVYVAVNALFHNDRLNDVPGYLRFLRDANVDAIVFSDPGVLMVARETAPELTLFWHGETTGTNWYSINFWGKKGARRAAVAREINLDAILEIKEKAEIEIEVQVHGMMPMFQSKRTLVGNYFEYQGKNLAIETTGPDRQMFLYDPERNAKYPIFEDENGTHIMSAKDVCMIDELEDLLEAKIDCFKIEGIFKTTEYMEKVIQLYREAISLYFKDSELYRAKKETFLEQIKRIQPPERELDTGFFFKETVY
mgnify:CR=1 FL=1